MHSVEMSAASGQYVQKVAERFVALYYPVLNNYAGYLYQFYGSDSTVVVGEVKEDGQSVTTKAESTHTVQEILRQLYEEVTIAVRNCTPQPSSGGCISLLITGIMTRKLKSEDRAFTQALILSRQCDGYYVKTDTVLVFPKMKSVSGTASLLSSQSGNTELTQSTEEGLKNGQRGTQQGDMNATMMNRVDGIHVHLPAHEMSNGTPMGGTSRGNMPTNHSRMGSMVTQPDVKGSFQYDRRACEKIVAHDLTNSATDPTMNNGQGCHSMSARTRNLEAFGYSTSMMPNPDRCNSPLSAPGVLASPMTADGIMADLGFTRLQPLSLESSPRFGLTETNQIATTDQYRLFACKLPLGVTVEVVTEVFSQYGTLSENEPVRVFTGQNNCYACVSFISEQGQQNAINAEVRIGDCVVVTDDWRPRDRRPRRRRPENAPESNPIGAAAN